MNGLTRSLLSLVESFRKYFVVKIPRTPSGKRRPCGTLLQLVVVILSGIPRISRSVENAISVARSKIVILLIFDKIAYFSGGQQQAGSLAGAAPCRKCIDRTQYQSHLAWKSRVECEGKRLIDCISNSKKCRDESRA